MRTPATQQTESLRFRLATPAAWMAMWVCGLVLIANQSLFADALLRDRIDRLINDGNRPAGAKLKTGGIDSRVVDDGTFLRRIYLDLNGVIPSANQTRAFLADKNPAKREQLVDQLLVGTRYHQHMADVFDVMLMERRADSHIKRGPWRAYLVESFEKNKPYNVLVGEIMAADGAVPKTRHRAAFYLNREGEPNLLTRDIGRIFFGRDLQCAQCHDHPNVDDLRQSEYYGLFAFVNRSSLFTDKKKVVSLAEKADGNANYKSVFTKASYTANPATPGSKPIAEPKLDSKTLYKVKPAKGVRSVPTFSRRNQLAVELAKGNSQAFRRNISNRLWALVMGRGLVYPVDMMHASNPPSNPKLLNLLADEFAAMNFDIKAMLRELVLTKAYQRPLDLPDALAKADIKQLDEQLSLVRAQRANFNDQLMKSYDQLDDADEALIKSGKALTALKVESSKLNKALAGVQKAAAPATKALATTQQQLTAKAKLKDAIDAAMAKAKTAATMLAQESAITKSVTLLETRAKQIVSEMTTLGKTHSKQTAAAKAATAKVTDVRTKADAARAKLAEANQSLIQVRSKFDTTLEAHNAHASALAMTDRAIKQTEAEIAYSQGKGESHEIARRLVAGGLSNRSALRPLKPLTPEQLAWSMMQAAGVVDAYRRNLPADLKKKADDIANKATAAARKLDKKAPPIAPKPVTPAAIEQGLTDKLAGSVGGFVSLFAAAGGQPQDTFFSTVDQALYFLNSSTLKSWLAPSGGYLIDRMNKQTDTKLLTQDLYLSVMTRFPTDNEINDVAEYLKGREKDRVAALQEMAWALMTTVEFRFCR